MRLQNHSDEAQGIVEAARNQQAIVHQRLQLHDVAHRRARLKSTRNRGGVTTGWEVEALEVIAICHISVLSRYRPSANHEAVAIQIKCTLLHYHPRQAHTRVDCLRNLPLLRTETIIRLVQPGLESDLAS